MTVTRLTTAGETRPGLVVLQAGVSSTLQDLGRPGYAAIGVTASGVLDVGLATALNRLVGNPPGAAVIETAGGLEVMAAAPVTIVDSTIEVPVTLRAGDVHRVRVRSDRAWGYLAVSGGIVARPVLGSCATDTLSGLGPAPLADGTELAIGRGSEPTFVDAAPLRALPTTIELVVGPRADWLTPAWVDTMSRTVWRSSAASRVGMRLTGTRLQRHPDRTGELPSEGLVRGAVQVPPSGEPVVMLADHPTTGGYPVVAVVAERHLDAIAQYANGQPFRFAVRAQAMGRE